MGLYRVARLVFVFLGVVALASCTGAGSMPGGGGGHSGPTPPPAPVRDDWTMYAHDAHHTSASMASIPGSLKTAWRYNPQPAPTGSTGVGVVYNAVGNINGIFVHYYQDGVSILSAGPSVDGVSTSGARLWQFTEQRDFDEGHWLSIFGNDVVLNDDGEPALDSGTGKVAKWLTSTYDSWGELIPDPTGLYGANTFLADGPDLFVYQISTSDAVTWKALQQKSTKYSQDSVGGTLLSNGTLFYAASYTDPSPNASGIYALNPSTGAKIGYVATNPVSYMSADASNIYLIENNTNLVARSQSNLQKIWSAAVSSFSGTAAPVLADGLVIVGGFTGITAYNATNGTVAWKSSVSPAGGFSGYSTSMCAALTSNTLVVTASDGVHVLNLANGNDVWHGAVSGAVGTVGSPIIVNDPARGATVYVSDSSGIIALVPG